MPVYVWFVLICTYMFKYGLFWSMPVCLNMACSGLCLYVLSMICSGLCLYV